RVDHPEVFRLAVEEVARAVNLAVEAVGRVVNSQARPRIIVGGEELVSLVGRYQVVAPYYRDGFSFAHRPSSARLGVAPQAAQNLARDFDRVQYVRDDGVGGRAIEFGLGAQGYSVAKGRRRDVAHVVRRCEVATAHGGEGLRAEQERDGGARACAVCDRGVLARAARDVNEVVLHARLHARSLYFGAAVHECVRLGERAYVHLFEPARAEARVPVADDLRLLFSRRVADENLQEEAVELRFGQRVRALVLNR